MYEKPKGKLIKALTRMIGIIIASVVAIYLGILVIMYFIQPGMVYFPSRVMGPTPENIGLEYEDVNLTTSDGIEINGWFIPAPQSRATLLFCHGNGGNISHRLESIKQFYDLGLSVFIFDYHGYGKSGGKQGEQETYFDAEAGWKYLTEDRGISPDSIIIFGRSLGGAVAVWLAANHTPKATIIESAFLSVTKLAGHYYPFLPVKLLARFKYSSNELIGQIDSPILIIHSPDDDIIPFSHGQKLFEIAGEPKQFLEISGRHNDGYLVSDAVYRSGLNSFLEKYL